MSFLPYAVAIWVIGVGLYGIVTSRDLVHLVICLAVMQSSSYLVLLAVGYVDDAKAPVFADIPLGTRAVDPVVQALTLTDVVVGTTVTALLLALSVQAHKRWFWPTRPPARSCTGSAAGPRGTGSPWGSRSRSTRSAPGWRCSPPRSSWPPSSSAGATSWCSGRSSTR